MVSPSSADSIADALSWMGGPPSRPEPFADESGVAQGLPEVELEEPADDESRPETPVAQVDGAAEDVAVAPVAAPAARAEADPAHEAALPPNIPPQSASLTERRRRSWTLGTLLLGAMALVMLALAGWATALLLGAPVPLAERPGASTMGWMMMVAWPLALLLLGFAWVMRANR